MRGESQSPSFVIFIFFLQFFSILHSKRAMSNFQTLCGPHQCANISASGTGKFVFPKKNEEKFFFVNFFSGIARIFFPPHRMYITYVCTSTCSRNAESIFYFHFLLRRLEELHVRRLNIFLYIFFVWE
jgi:hypothetical protein